MKNFLVFSLCLMVSAALLPACSSHSKRIDIKNQADASRNLGEAYMAEGNYTKALRELLKAEQLNSDDPYLQNDLGLTYLAKGDPKASVSHFKKAVKSKPDYAPARNNLGSAHVALEQWEEAIECFKEVKDDLLYATPYYPLSNLGYVYFRLGDYDAAKLYYQEALDLRPDFPKAIHGLGQVYLKTGEYEKAVGKLEQAVELVPTAARLLLDLGRAYEKTHEYNRAMNAYKKAASMSVGTATGEEAQEAARALQNMW